MANPASPRRRPFFLIPIWAGIGVPGWLRLLARHRFAIHWSRSFFMVLGTVLSVLNSALALIQSAAVALRRRAANPEPIFILGHWRSGTTMLHELLALDSRFAFPTSYACFAPTHFLVSERILGPFVQLLSPRRRPQDDMRAGVERPQEDEFAMLACGMRSPYSMFLFPGRDTPDLAYLDFEGVPPAGVARWIAGHRRFLATLAWRDPRPMVLKSPTHTARLALLAAAYPRARFIHIVRDPRSVIPSTRNMVEALGDTFGLQLPNRAHIRSLVFRLHERLHRRLEEGRTRVESHRFHELRYEDLVADPGREMRRLYEQLSLGGFEAVEPRIAAYFAETRSFKPATYALSAEEKRDIETQCVAMMRRYGYAPDPQAAAAAAG